MSDIDPRDRIRALVEELERLERGISVRPLVSDSNGIVSEVDAAGTARLHSIAWKMAMALEVVANHWHALGALAEIGCEACKLLERVAAALEDAR